MKQIGSAVAGLAVALTLGACGSPQTGMEAPSSGAFESTFSQAGDSPRGEAMTRQNAETPANREAANETAARRAIEGNPETAGATPLLAAGAGTRAGRGASPAKPGAKAAKRAKGPREVALKATGETPVTPIVPAFPARIKYKTLQDLGTVFFGFDRAGLSAETKAVLDTNIAWLKAHPDLGIRLLGHADERGTSEYNLGLGYRRANKVREYLIDQGLAPETLLTVSYGEEVPLHRGRGEASWRQNRRVEFSLAEATAALAR